MEYNFPNLKIKKPVILDFGAAGKGYLIDIVSRLIEENGYTEYCVDAGGDIYHRSKDKLKIGLENPKNTEEALGVYELGNESICGSAGHRRSWGDFTHIINPKTLKSPKEIIALWVVADSAIVADAIATCLFFVPADKVSKYKFKYLIVRDDFSIEKSPDFNAELFIN